MAFIKSFGEKAPEVLPAAFIAENATIVGDVRLGKDTSVWYAAVLRGDSGSITIGEGTNIQDGAVLHTGSHNDVLVGNYVTIGHCAIVHGCTVGDGALIGMHATVLNGAVIGEGAVVAAGALVTENTVIPPHSMAMGVPAKVRGEVSPEMLDKDMENAVGYVETAKRHARL